MTTSTNRRGPHTAVADSHSSPERGPAHSDTNLAILRGRVTTEPLTRELVSGLVVVHFDVTIRAHDQSVGSVPIAWHDPTAAALSNVHEDVEVLIIGTVRRRFFRAGGATQSRTEVVADHVVPTSRGKTVRSALRAAADLIAR